MPDEWPTFDRCPNCSGMLWTDATTEGAWCRDCDYAITQTSLDL